MSPQPPLLLQEKQDKSAGSIERRRQLPYIQITLLWALSLIVGATATLIAIKVGSISTIVSISLAVALPLGWISFVAGIRKIIAVMLLPKTIAAFGSILMMSTIVTGVAAIISMNLALFGIEPWVYSFLGVAILLCVAAQAIVRPTAKSLSIFAARALTGAIAGTLAIAALGVMNIDRILIGATTGTLVAAIVSLLLDSILKKFTNDNYPKQQAIRLILLTVSFGLALGMGIILMANN